MKLPRLACLGLAFALAAVLGGTSPRDALSASIAAGQAVPRVAVYRGKLGPRGRIRISIAGSRAMLYFTAQCKQEGRVAGHTLIGTSPEATEPSFEPVAARVRGGRIALDVERSGESNDEARAGATAHIQLHARRNADRVSGTFSIDVEEGGTNVFGEPEAIEHCRTPDVSFTAARVGAGG